MSRLVGILASLLLLSNSAMAAPSCLEVKKQLGPCLIYLRGNMPGLLDDQPSERCCSGVKNVSNMVKSKADRKATCECLKEILSKFGNYDPARIPLLPKKCGVFITLPPINKNTDCAKALVYHAG